MHTHMHSHTHCNTHTQDIYKSCVEVCVCRLACSSAARHHQAGWLHSGGCWRSASQCFQVPSLTSSIIFTVIIIISRLTCRADWQAINLTGIQAKHAHLPGVVKEIISWFYAILCLLFFFFLQFYIFNWNKSSFFPMEEYSINYITKSNLDNLCIMSKDNSNCINWW